MNHLCTNDWVITTCTLWSVYHFIRLQAWEWNLQPWTFGCKCGNPFIRLQAWEWFSRECFDLSPVRTNHAENPLSHVRVEGLGLVLVTKMKPGRRWVLVAQLWYPRKKGQVHWYLHTMKESGNSEGKKYLDVIRGRFRLQKTTVTILSLHCLLPHMGKRFPIFGTGCMYSSVMPAAPCIPSPPTNHGRKQP